MNNEMKNEIVIEIEKSWSRSLRCNREAADFDFDCEP